MRRTQQLLFCTILLVAQTSWGQEKAKLTESEVCSAPVIAPATCKEEHKLLKKSLSVKEREVYTEYYDTKGELQSVELGFVGGEGSCSRYDKKMSCIFGDLALSPALTSAKKMAVYKSNESFAKALGLKTEEVAALGIDWGYEQAVVWVAKAPKSKGFVVTPGELSFETTKGNAGKLTLSFYESCPHGGIPGSDATPAPGLSKIFVLVPLMFTISSASTKLEKAGFDPSRCNTIP
jgi:hypothetical protein